ncbi:MAG: hypothetical protein JSR46_02810 [Verrucomicrobia bacterium]|nr:hypothetical protein [Verrucomicrobiota bacterium]
MASVGTLQGIETCIYNQIEECQNWLDKTLKPLRDGVDDTITSLARKIVEQEVKQAQILQTGVQVLDSFIDEVRCGVVRNEIIGFCWTCLRVNVLTTAVLVLNHPLTLALSTLALLGHAIFKGLLVLEKADRDNKPIDDALDHAMDAVLFEGILLPLEQAVNRTVRALTDAADDLDRAKNLFKTIGRLI